MGVAQDAGDVGGEGAFFQNRREVFILEVSGFLPREPVPGVPDEVVAHLAEIDHVEAFGEGPQTQDFSNVDLAGNVVGMRKPFVPVVSPLGAEFFFQCLEYPGFNFPKQRKLFFQPLDGGNVFDEVRRARSADGQRVYVGISQAEQVVEGHGRKRPAEVNEFGRRLVEHAAFIDGADDEHAHILRDGGVDGGAVAGD